MLPRFPSFERHIDRRIRVHGCGEIASRVSGVLQPYPPHMHQPVKICAICAADNFGTDPRVQPEDLYSCDLDRDSPDGGSLDIPRYFVQNIEYSNVPPPPPGQPRTSKKGPYRGDRLTYKEKKQIQEKTSTAKVDREVFWTTGDYPKSPTTTRSSQPCTSPTDALPTHRRQFLAALDSLKQQEDSNNLWKEVIDHSRFEATRRKKEITLQFNKAASKLLGTVDIERIEVDAVPVAAESSSPSKRRREEPIPDVPVVSVTDSLLEKKYLPLSSSVVIGDNWVFLEGHLKKQYVLGLLSSLSDRVRFFLDPNNLGHSPRSTLSQLIAHLNSVYRRYISIRNSVFYAVRGWERDIITFLDPEPTPLAPVGELNLLSDETLSPFTVSAAGHVALGRAIQSAIKAKESFDRQARRETISRNSRISKDLKASSRRSTSNPDLQPAATTQEEKDSLSLKLDIARKAYSKFTGSGAVSPSNILPPIVLDDSDSDVAVTHSSEDNDGEEPLAKIPKKN
ncbi:hypothetical protein BC829DRAFT_489292 [Chytridium lagenaria]|nr:hypothetical protein BC829DRAFT_489292 [Chytridium lagenaria]